MRAPPRETPRGRGVSVDLPTTVAVDEQRQSSPARSWRSHLGLRESGKRVAACSGFLLSLPGGNAGSVGWCSHRFRAIGLLQPAVLGQPWQAQLNRAASCVSVPQQSAFASGSQQLDRVLDGSIRLPRACGRGRSRRRRARGCGELRGSRCLRSPRRKSESELGFGERAVDAPGPGGHVGARGRVHAWVGDHVCDREPSAGAQHPGCLADDLRLVGGEVDTQLEITTSTVSSRSGISSM